MGIARELVVSDFGKLPFCRCKICTQLVEDPVVLKCDHYYCKKCIQKKIQEDAVFLIGTKLVYKIWKNSLKDF